LKKIKDDKVLCFLLYIGVGTLVGALLFLLTKRKMFFTMGPSYGILLSLLMRAKE